MGYHVSLVNTENCADSEKIIKDKAKFKAFLTQHFNLVEECNADGELEYFYDQADPEFTLFYTAGIEGEYYINTTNDQHIERLIAIAEKLNDGTRVRGDEGESYRSLTESYIHPDDEHLVNAPLPDELKPKSRLNYIIFGILLILGAIKCYLVLKK